MLGAVLVGAAASTGVVGVVAGALCMGVVSTTDCPVSFTLSQLKNMQLAAKKAAHHMVALKRKVVPPLLPKTPWLEAVKKLPPFEGCKRTSVITSKQAIT